MITVKKLVDLYQLQPHPEGGYYKETYRAAENVPQSVLPARFPSERSFSTGIYFLLEAKQFSAFHRIKSDEMWHFYTGGPLNIYVLQVDGNLQVIKLGSNILNGETYQAVVPAGCWFASRPAIESGFCFVGCTVAPGFDFDDFEMATAAEVISEFPQHATLIGELTR